MFKIYQILKNLCRSGSLVIEHKIAKFYINQEEKQWQEELF